MAPTRFIKDHKLLKRNPFPPPRLHSSWHMKNVALQKKRGFLWERERNWKGWHSFNPRRNKSYGKDQKELDISRNSN